jgi:ABC-type multidrug transport system, ATPase and permease components
MYAMQVNLNSRNQYGQILISGLFIVSTLLLLDYRSLTKQDLLVLTMYLQQFARMIPGFGQTICNMMTAYPDLKIVMTELLKPSMVKDPFPDVALRTNDLPPNIEFRHVSFHFDLKQDERK